MPIHREYLLVIDIGTSMLWWEADYCRMLADDGRFMIPATIARLRSSSSPIPRPSTSGCNGRLGRLRCRKYSMHMVCQRLTSVGVSAVRAFTQVLALDFAPLRPSGSFCHQHLTCDPRCPRASTADRGFSTFVIDGRGGRPSSEQAIERAWSASPASSSRSAAFGEAARHELVLAMSNTPAMLQPYGTLSCCQAMIDVPPCRPPMLPL